MGCNFSRKFSGVFRGFVRIERFGILPNFHQREMIMPAVVFQQLKTNDARIVPAFRGELLQEFGAVLNKVGSEVDVSNHVEFVAREPGREKPQRMKVKSARRREPARREM